MGGTKFEKLKKTSRGNASMNMYAKFCDDRTIFRHLKIRGTESGTYIQTDRQTDIQTDIQNFFFIVVLGLWEASKLTKKILSQSEKITDRIHYGIICPEFFGHIKSKEKKKFNRNEKKIEIENQKKGSFSLLVLESLGHS